MKMIRFNSRVACLLALVLLSACSYGGDTNDYVSALNRPMAITLAVLDWTPGSDEIAYAEAYPDDWGRCLGMDKRAFAFIANSSGNSVARLDTCKGDILNAEAGGNPYIVSHIPVGISPDHLATSIDDNHSRIFVSNGGEDSLTIIDSVKAVPFQNKVSLSSRPSHLLVVPSHMGNPEGDVYVALASEGALSRVVKHVEGAGSLRTETWTEDQMATLFSAEWPNPVPGNMTLDEARNRIYVADMNQNVFHIVDLDHPENPSETREVGHPQRSCAMSPDGRFLYLAKLDQRQIAVYDLVNDLYVDTNEELPSHANNPPPTDDTPYDIQVQSIPRLIQFVTVEKTFAPTVTETDGDWDTEFDDDSDLDSDVDSDSDTETDTEQETTDGDTDETDGDTEADESDETDTTDNRSLLSYKADAEDDATDDDTPAGAKTYAYTIGQNGIVQVIDAHSNLHELFDTAPNQTADMRLLSGDDLEIDNGQCLADIDYRVTKGRTPDGLWELEYNGIVRGASKLVAGRFDMDGCCFNDPSSPDYDPQDDCTATNDTECRLYDSTIDFSTLTELMARPADAENSTDGFKKGDLLEIVTNPNAAPVNENGQIQGLGCIEFLEDEDGSMRAVKMEIVTLEILDITPDYLVVDRRNVKMQNCFNSAVEYNLRANGNYIVRMTELDVDGNLISSAQYQGRALNREFLHGQVIEGETQMSSYNFEDVDWEDYMCRYELENSEGSIEYRYEFRRDLSGTDNSGEIFEISGMRCQNPWYDGTESPSSFSNDLLTFTVCQDERDNSIRLKQQGSFRYSFRTFSGISQIQQDYGDDETVDDRVGTRLEDAVFLNFYEGFPRLYVLDSTLEKVYVIDLVNDKLLDLYY